MLDVHRSEGIARVTLSRPPVNAINGELVAKFTELVSDLRRDRELRAVVLDSSLGLFSAGADITMMRAFLDAEDGPDRITSFSEEFQVVLRRFASLPIPTIAKIGGTAVGGGLEIAMACDIRIAAAGVRLGLPESRIGLLPGGGGTQRLAELSGPGFAIQAISTGELFTSETAYARGIVTEVVAPEQLEDRVAAIATAMARSDRETLSRIKACVLGTVSGSGYAAETEATRVLAALPSTRAAMDAFISTRPSRRNS